MLRSGRRALTALVLWPSAVFCAPISVESAIEAARGADVVIVGEVHDNPAHHAVQARFATQLAPRTLVFEMLRPDDPAAIAGLTDPVAAAAALDWPTRGWPDFAEYHQILLAAPKARVMGVERPGAEVRAAVQRSAADVFGVGAERFGLAQALPAAEQTAREARQAAAHCDALPAQLLPGMVEAQRLRDADLAHAVADALAADGGPVLVITGNGHAHPSWGVPALLRQAAPGLEVFVFRQFEVAAPATAEGAYAVTAPVKRPDPCAAFAN